MKYTAASILPSLRGTSMKNMGPRKPASSGCLHLHTQYSLFKGSLKFGEPRFLFFFFLKTEEIWLNTQHFSIPIPFYTQRFKAKSFNLAPRALTLSLSREKINMCLDWQLFHERNGAVGSGSFLPSEHHAYTIIVWRDILWLLFGVLPLLASLNPSTLQLWQMPNTLGSHKPKPPFPRHYIKW